MTPRQGRATAEPAPVDCVAARKSCDAVLRAAGRRLTHGTGHHAAYLAEARRLLGTDVDTSRLLTRLDAARTIRNGTQYRLREVTTSELVALRTAAEDILGRATAFVDDVCH